MRGRRRFLRDLLAVSAAAAVPRATRGLVGGLAPAVQTSRTDLPEITHGVASGDLDGESAMVWARVDRPARMLVEWATEESFRDARRVVGPVALPETGLTACAQIEGLPPGQRIAYRVTFEDLADLRRVSAPAVGSFRAAASGGDGVRLAWSADTCGQGWGIDPSRGGLRLYETMLRAAPDVFVHCGDTIYADAPLPPEIALDDGSVWRNLVTPAKAKVAETLDEFRGNHLYNLSDPHMRAFNASASQIVLWDDHEVRDNWHFAQRLERDERYLEKSVAVLAARARKAFLEHQPIRAAAGEPERIHRTLRLGPLLEVFALDLRSDRGPNSLNDQPVPGPETAILGARQLAWLKRRLAASTALWKVIASDMPIGLVVRDFPDRFEAVANGEPGAPLGREHEIADLLSSMQRDGVRNVVWITGDVHYCAAHHYHPDRASFRRFDPFWELVAGPLHAGTFGPNALDATFGPEVRFLGIPEGMKPNRPPSDGFQFFGTLDIDGGSGVLTAALHDVEGRALWSQELEPVRG
ncbi:MAG TPA: alkaline phosphatase D family protein [Thermoanaerobaculia bacterium]|nr:alkaline phosphatase D family protein [Thermoanaerobaculia bacterium]